MKNFHAYKICPIGDKYNESVEGMLIEYGEIEKDRGDEQKEFYLLFTKSLLSKKRLREIKSQKVSKIFDYDEKTYEEKEVILN